MGNIGDIGLKKIYVGDVQIKQAYVGADKVYSSGNIAMYYVDSNAVYTEEVECDASCLAPTSFIPAKSGYTFVGWREDTVASATVLTEKVMGDEAITLYAVFRKTITLTLYNGSTSATTKTGYQYYNNGNVANPTFTATQAALSGWTARGWATGTAANAAVAYNNGVAFAITDSVTLYGMYQQTITVTYYNNSMTATATSGTRYYNSNGNVINPSFTIAQATKNGWTARGWATETAANATTIYSSLNNTTIATSVTLYGLYYKTVTLSYNGNGSTSGATAQQAGTCYYNSAGNTSNATFTVAANGFAKTSYIFANWTLGSTGGTEYAAGSAVTLSSNATMYAAWVVASASNFAYTGGVQTFIVPATGLYKLETWGAQGGDAYQKDDDGNKQYGTGGKGGYSVGYIKLAKGEVLYVVVGGEGETVTVNGDQGAPTGGGYNGGGDTCLYYGDSGKIGAGGGATHIAKRTGLLSELENYKSTILMVAPGGGGVRTYGNTEYSYGGDGGGLTGGDGTGYSTTNGKGGTQTAGGNTGGTFGKGGGGLANAGGGGGYYGGGANGGGGAGGGSAYIGGVPAITHNSKTYSPSTTAGQNEGDGKAALTYIAA